MIEHAAQKEYERAITRAAKDEAESHVMDVVCVVEQQLRRLRWNNRPEHDGKVSSREAIVQGSVIVSAIIRMLPKIVELDYTHLVQSEDDDARPLDDENAVVNDVRQHIRDLLANLKVSP